MKLYISNASGTINKEVGSPKFIPRKGDRIDLGYAPAATVTDVLFIYGKEEIVYIKTD